MILNNWNGRPTEMILDERGRTPRYRELIIGQFDDFDVWFETDFGPEDSTKSIWKYTDKIEVWMVKDGKELGREEIWSAGGPEAVTAILEAFELALAMARPNPAVDALSDWLDAQAAATAYKAYVDGGSKSRPWSEIKKELGL